MISVTCSLYVFPLGLEAKFIYSCPPLLPPRALPDIIHPFYPFFSDGLLHPMLGAVAQSRK